MNEAEEREHLDRIYKALEIVLRVAVTALADAKALEVQMKGADLVEPEFETLRQQLRAGMLDELRKIFQAEPQDLLQRLRDFEGTVQ